MDRSPSARTVRADPRKYPRRASALQRPALRNVNVSPRRFGAWADCHWRRNRLDLWAIGHLLIHHLRTNLLAACAASVLAACAASLLALAGCGHDKQKDAAGKSTPEAGYVVLRQQNVPLRLLLPGRTTAFETSEVRPQVS